jgi:uncharacterized protein
VIGLPVEIPARASDEDRQDLSAASDEVPHTPAPNATSRVSPIDVVVVVHGVFLAVVVGVDGPAPWPSVRALVALGLTFAALVVSRRSGPRRRGSALLTVGLAGVIIGGGIGVPHAVKDGVSAESVAGIAALATGLALIAVATTILLRGTRWWRKLLAVPVGIGVAVFIVMPLTMAVFVTNVPPLALGDATPADRGLAFEEVSIRAADGVQLAAWYVPSANGAAVVLLGGATNTRSDEIDHAAVLARNGYGVLLLDARGHGESDGDAMLWGWFGETDVRAAVDHLTSRPDVIDGRIGAVGMSMGAEEAIGAAGSDTRIRAVVAEGASARGPLDEGDPAEGVGGWLIRYVDWTATRAVDLMTSADRPVKLRDAIAAAAPRPFMIIAAGTQPVEIDAGNMFQAVSPDSVELWVVPNAGHTEGYDVQPAEWEARVIAFLDRSLD